MSSKINIWSIVTGHITTLNDASSGRVSVIDYFTFYGIPLALAFFLSFLGIKVTGDANSLLVNFGAIFTALLLSVLVLVYDQGEKLRDVSGEKSKHNIELKKKLLEQLYFNICYAIVVSVILVFFCLVYTFLPDDVFSVSISKLTFNADLKLYLVSPVILMVVMNLLLTILMVVKRMHTLLTIKI
ncbi:hypothetical protein [Marinobacter sp. LV10MA510-1]|uniref:hypothetical protein n=1 Tax=Marinobacter sp. LV10MA510-1 TaxID=1415567 RepID=UPI000BF951D0|nr:hypothetical protein [Marinobacter sp. LV10MA510-1]PFG10681.1 hypothetical protein ATI45_3149 [Marinobacter sp. LV10MA510-1]